MSSPGELQPLYTSSIPLETADVLPMDSLPLLPSTHNVHPIAGPEPGSFSRLTPADTKNGLHLQLAEVHARHENENIGITTRQISAHETSKDKRQRTEVTANHLIEDAEADMTELETQKDAEIKAEEAKLRKQRSEAVQAQLFSTQRDHFRKDLKHLQGGDQNDDYVKSIDSFLAVAAEKVRLHDANATEILNSVTTNVADIRYKFDTEIIRIRAQAKRHADKLLRDAATTAQAEQVAIDHQADQDLGYASFRADEDAAKIGAALDKLKLTPATAIPELLESTQKIPRITVEPKADLSNEQLPVTPVKKVTIPARCPKPTVTKYPKLLAVLDTSIPGYTGNKGTERFYKGLAATAATLALIISMSDKAGELTDQEPGISQQIVNDSEVPAWMPEPVAAWQEQVAITAADPRIAYEAEDGSKVNVVAGSEDSPGMQNMLYSYMLLGSHGDGGATYGLTPVPEDHENAIADDMDIDATDPTAENSLLIAARYINQITANLYSDPVNVERYNADPSNQTFYADVLTAWGDGDSEFSTISPDIVGYFASMALDTAERDTTTGKPEATPNADSQTVLRQYFPASEWVQDNPLNP